MYEAQTQLADAYLSSGQAAEARAIAEDLVAREPWEGAHIERFRRALVMLRVSEPDTVIAERLSGSTPFVARDHFSGAVEAPAVPSPQESIMPPAEPPAARAARSSEPSARSPNGGLSLPATPARGGPEIDLSGALGELEDSEAGTPPRARRVSATSSRHCARTRRSGEGADQSAQHMKLARTYLEMGMLQEATTSLKMAARSPRRRFEAAAMLGRLYREHGEITDAIEWLERAAEATMPTPEEGHALLYDLGPRARGCGRDRPGACGVSRAPGARR